MREWQVGDPIGDGNDIGVPDIPYMDYLKDKESYDKPGKKHGNPREKTPEDLAEELREILERALWDDFEIAKLVGRSLTLMRSNDCRVVEVAKENYGLDIMFEKEHKYFTTRYECEYVPGSVRVFEEFGMTHNHDKLLLDESFKRLIRDTENKTGFEFKECGGGYGAQLDEDRFNFIFNDEIDVFVRFDMKNGKTAVYDLDLDNMKLSEDYRIY